MKRFTKAEIDSIREKYIGEGYPQKTSRVGETPVDYILLPTHLGKSAGLSQFLVRATGNPGDGYFVGVSDNTPEHLQNAYAYAEWAEFMKYGLEDSEKTMNAERDVISRLSGDVQREYAERKANLYFEMLIGVSDKGLDYWKFSIDDVKGFARARRYLNSVAAEHKA